MQTCKTVRSERLIKTVKDREGCKLDYEEIILQLPNISQFRIVNYANIWRTWSEYAYSQVNLPLFKSLHTIFRFLIIA